MVLKLNKETKFLIILFTISLLIRFIAFYGFFSKDKNYWNMDTIAYDQAAISLYEGKGFSNADGTPHFYRLPLYSTFLAICYKFFGHDIKNALWVQTISASFIPILIFFLSLSILPSNLFLAKIISLFSSLHLGFILYSSIAMTETIFLIFFFLFCILFFRNIRPNNAYHLSSKEFLIAGIFLGLASLVRPVGHYLIITSLPMILLNRTNIFNSLKNMTWMLSGWSIIVIPWLIRNFLLTGYIFFHTLPGIHFLRYSATPILMKTDNLTYNEAWGRLLSEWKMENDKQEDFLNRPLLEIEKCKNAEKISFNYLKKNPLLALRYAIFNIFKTCIGLYSSELLYIDGGLPPHCFEKDRGWWRMFERFIIPKTSHPFYIVIIYFEIITMFLILLGFALEILYLFNKVHFYEYLKILPFIFLFIFITLASGFARVRLPIEPFIMIMSLNWWINFFKSIQFSKLIKQVNAMN